MLFTLSSVSLLLSGGLFARSLHHSHRYESTFSFPGLVKMFYLMATSSRERLVSFSWVDPFSSLIFLGLCSNRFLQIPQRDTGFESGSWCGLSEILKTLSGFGAEGFTCSEDLLSDDKCFTKYSTTLFDYNSVLN